MRFKRISGDYISVIDFFKPAIDKRHKYDIICLSTQIKVCEKENFMMKRISRRILTVILAAILLLTLFGCGENGFEKPETNLEFWICDNEDDIDLSNCKARYGMMGGQEYYGSAYTPTINEDGEQTDPEECVIYTITSYPDYSDKTQRITRITITDPAVNVYGLTVKSTADEIETAMKKYGFKTVEAGAAWNPDNPYGLLYKKGKINLNFYDNRIIIAVCVSNKTGIMF